MGGGGRSGDMERGVGETEKTEEMAVLGKKVVV